MIIGFMGKLFGTDGIRARAGDFPLDVDTVRAVGYLLARYFLEKLTRPPRFLIGRDTRESGPWIEKAFREGAVIAGATCESVGVITTPGVAFLTQNFGFDAGVVVSASHNPFYDNGIKIFSSSGKKLDDEIERYVEERILSGFKISPAEALDVRTSVDPAYYKAYLDHLARTFDHLKLDNLKLVIDCANGAASILASQLFSHFGCQVKLINAEPNGSNINENCGSLHIDNLREEVLKVGADIGIAFDGDADRAIFVDENGETVDGDGVLYVLSDFLRQQGRLKNGVVVATVMSNIGLELALEKKGLKLVRVAVGDKYVLDELLRTGSDLGGEQSGHVILPFRSLAGDGMQTSLFILKAISEAQKPLSDLTRGFIRFPQILLNVAVKEKKPFEQAPQVIRVLREIEQEIGEKGRILLRYSGTENLARIMIEGEDETKIKSQALMLAEAIRTALG
jgi:phosphoglucosamine mutase